MLRFVFLLLFLVSSMRTCLGQDECASYTYYKQEISRNPSLSETSDQVEAFLKNRLSPGEPRSSPPGVGASELTIFKIPVVVHILYNNDVQKISRAQVHSQMEALNRDFRNLNPASPLVPAHFRSLGADCFIEFSLATLDPQGKPTTGIIWKKTNNTSFSTDDRIKFSKYGGSDGWDSDSYLNIWVGNLSAGNIGYSSSPGAQKEKDGIVIKYSAFGTMGTATAPHHLGRIAVHETGHWLGLKHIWGDRYCGDDEIEDTPPQKGPTRGCPTGIIASCDNATSGSMYMNYMDVTHDACINLFTFNQRSRMRALFAEGGPRHALLRSRGSFGPPVLIPVEIPTDSIREHQAYVYPNPANNSVTLYTRNQIGEPLVIYDKLGQLALRSYVVSDIMRVNIATLRKGIYFIKVGKASRVLRVMKIN